MQEFGDGIMSAIDMFASIDDIVGGAGEKRVVITLNGKVSTTLYMPAAFGRTINLSISCILGCPSADMEQVKGPSRSN